MTTIDSIPSVHDARPGTPNGDPRRLIQSRIAVALADLGELIAALPTGALARQAGPVFQNATIGQHLRHTLDHVRTVTSLDAKGTLDYDSRERGTPIEHDHGAALTEIARLIALLAAHPSEDLSLTLVAIVTPDGDRVRMRTTQARELAFVLSHTVHHAATIRSIAASFGLAPSAHIGVAPATESHRNGTAPCAH